MTPLKDLLEVASPVGGPTTTHPSEPSKAESGDHRSDAVSLDVPLKVHGSRVTEVVRGITPHSEPFEEQTATMIVFPQGGVVRMSTPVTTGQMVVITNLKSGSDAICRVVKIRACPPSQSFVELEFTNRQPGYWGVHFGGEATQPAKAVAPPPPVVREARVAEPDQSAHRPAPEIPRAPAVAQETPAERAAQPGKTHTSFVGIGSQEEVQPAASGTGDKIKATRTAAPVETFSMSELRGDSRVPPAVSTLGAGVPGEMTEVSEASQERLQEKPAATFEKFAASASQAGAHAAPERAFGARFDSGAFAAGEQAGGIRKVSGHNGLLLVGGVAALLMIAVGGAFYFHLLPGEHAAARPAPAPPAASLAMTKPDATVNRDSISPDPEQPTRTAVSNPVAPAAAPGVSRNSVRALDAAPPKVGKTTLAEQPLPDEPPAGPKASAVIPDISSAVSAHPVAAPRAASQDADSAPSVDSGEASSDLEQIGSSSAALPPPAAPLERVRVGGDVRPPRIVSSPPPVYPEMAKDAGVQGRVVIEASVDEHGKVVGTKVISGPAMLRQAAAAALREWKYQPATLDGKPVPVQITVTLNFRQ